MLAVCALCVLCAPTPPHTSSHSISVLVLYIILNATLNFTCVLIVISRIREAALNKKKKEADEEAFFAVNEERYNKGLQQMAEGPKPFRYIQDYI